MMWLYIAKKIIKIFIAELYTILYIIFYYNVLEISVYGGCNKTYAVR